MKQMKVALPDELRQRLDAASEKSGRSVAEEIRARVEASFMRDAVVDKPTRDFLEGLALMPAEVELETGAAWHKHAGAWETLRAAILARLGRLKPKGSAAFGPRPHQAIPGPDDTQAIGQWIEYQLHETPDFTTSPLRRALEESLRQMMEFRRQSEKKGGKS
jgi:hypothetical protein